MVREARRAQDAKLIRVSTPPSRQGGPLGFRSLTSVDGTRLRTWTNGGHGTPVLISNGLGTPHDAWATINERTDTLPDRDVGPPRPRRIRAARGRGPDHGRGPHRRSDRRDGRLRHQAGRGDRVVVGRERRLRGGAARPETDRRRAGGRRGPGRNLRRAAAPATPAHQTTRRTRGVTPDAIPRSGPEPDRRRTAGHPRARLRPARDGHLRSRPDARPDPAESRASLRRPRLALVLASRACRRRPSADGPERTWTCPSPTSPARGMRSRRRRTCARQANRQQTAGMWNSPQHISCRSSSRTGCRPNSIVSSAAAKSEDGCGFGAAAPERDGARPRGTRAPKSAQITRHRRRTRALITPSDRRMRPSAQCNPPLTTQYVSSRNVPSWRVRPGMGAGRGVVHTFHR